MDSNIQPYMNIQLSFYELFKVSGGLMTSDKHTKTPLKYHYNFLNMNSQILLEIVDILFLFLTVAYEFKKKINASWFIFRLLSHHMHSNTENKPKTWSTFRNALKNTLLKCCVHVYLCWKG